MLYRLSVAWGVPKTVLEQSLSGAELRGYCLYYQLEPWGSEVTDHWGQTLAYTVAQSQSTKRLNPDDFAPPWRKEEKKAGGMKLVPFEVGAYATVAAFKKAKRRAK